MGSGVCSRRSKATAAIEFAILAPVITTFLAAAADYGLAMWSRSCLSNAVAQGAYYASITGTSVTAANVTTVVQNASPLTGVTATVSDPTKCYCPSGGPATLGSAVSCASTCTDGTTPGTYVQITASYTLTAYLPLKSLLNADTVSDTAIVRLK